MNARVFEIFRQEFTHNLRRPLFWFQILLVGFFVFELSRGQAQMSSGDARVGGHKAWITSEFAVSQLLIMMVSIIYTFFVSVGAGMSVIRDEDQKVTELLHATRLTPGEYVWGKYLAVLASFAWVLAMQLGLMMLFNHVMPHGSNADSIGPFAIMNYLRPVFVFALPMLILSTGVAFAVGGLTRNAILVFVLPVGVLLFGAFFLWDWSPSWLSLHINRLLQFADLTGLRWINETWLKVDKGVDFYNHQPVGLDLLIGVQRLLGVAVGLGSVGLLQARLAAQIRGAKTVKMAKRGGAAAVAGTATAVAAPDPAPLATLAMRSGMPTRWASARAVAAVEWRELWKHPGLYLFIPMILIQVFAGVVDVGAFSTPLLQTSGQLAVKNMNTLTLLICMMILFYTVESLQREKSSGLAPVLHATPLRTGAMLVGKCLANAAVGVAVLLTTLIGCAIVLAIQGKVALDLRPFVLSWGLLLMPTFILWTAFVCAAYAITGNRYGAYVAGIGAMAVSGFFQARDKMNWVFNWDLWSAVRWSDISVFELDRAALVLNRVLALGLAVFFVALTVRLFERRERDATRLLHALRPRQLGLAALGMAPFAVLPLVCSAWLGLMVHDGRGGEAMKKLEKDYWKKNAETWYGVKSPSLASVTLDLDVDPPSGRLHSRGEYLLVNRTTDTLAQVAVTGGMRWKNVRWTMDGDSAKPDDRAHLYVFTPPRPMLPGDRMRIGFAFDNRVPDGVSRNGGGLNEFVLPSGAVLTGFTGPWFAPIVGYQDKIGIEKDKNETDPRVYPADWWKHALSGALPMMEGWCDTKIRLTSPAAYQHNATGELVGERVQNGKRITEWRSDAPVRAFNVVLGKWAVKRREGVAVFYDPRHAYNVDEMLDALAGAKRYYGEWFAPYPWKELRVSEFPGLAIYAQGSPTNITFSENIGFLTKSEPKANAAFCITAHEAAHQWWPGMAMPGEGPGGEVLSEGMAHFSTILLTEQVRGLEQRIAFCNSVEERYGDTRQKDSERPLVEVDGSLPGDQRIIYDRGGFAFWMLHRLIGRENSLAGLKEYMATWRNAEHDHPLIQDYLAVMRRHAPDTTAFDAYVKQWFYGTVVPQYLVEDAKLVRVGNAWEVRARVKNSGTGTMPIEVAAESGERFAKKRTKDNAWKDARVSVVLGAGEEKAVVIPCVFAPERVVVDPDVTVLMLERKKAEVKVKAEGGALASR
jgi:ABC-type transport system involved in multi-copper enzyme maturation permease subunit